jgi:hypothetical protein
MSRSRGTTSLAAAAIIGLLVAHVATAQETKRQGLPLGVYSPICLFFHGQP